MCLCSYATNRVQVGTYLGYVITSQLECWVERSDVRFEWEIE